MRYALRTMRKSPGFTAVAIATLALGIGANTAIFSFVNALLLESLPAKDPARLVAIIASSAARGASGYLIALPAYEEMRDGARLLSGLAAWCADGLTITGGETPEHLSVARVSPNFFDLLGARPMLGRAFQPAEGDAGAPPVAILSYQLWQRRFGADPAIVNRAVTLDQDRYTIIGVMPPEYPFPVPATDLWVTRLFRFSALQPEQIRGSAGYLRLIGRLAPGVSIAQASDELQALHVQYKRGHPRAPDGTPDSRMSAAAFQENITAGIRPTLMILTGAVAFVLLIACSNVAGLLMARATARAREIALRARSAPDAASSSGNCSPKV